MKVFYPTSKYGHYGQCLCLLYNDFLIKPGAFEKKQTVLCL